MNSKLKAIALCSYIALSGLALSAHANQAFIFGDSQSDSGNYFALFGDMSIQPFEADNVPSSPYAVGGHHFTNGRTWAELLTHSLGVTNSGKPAVLAPGLFGNYAVGRSRARDIPNGVFDEITFTDQIDRFLGDYDQQAPGSALYIIWIGANDLADALTDPNPNEILTAALTTTFTQIQRLYFAGARRFLILNMPDFSLTPRVLDLTADIPEPYKTLTLQGITLASVGYNQQLQANLDAMTTVFTDMQVTVFDAFGLLNEIVADPASYGLKVVDKTCIEPGSLGKVFCTHPDKYLFWDSQHPTNAIQGLIAEEIRALLLDL